MIPASENEDEPVIFSLVWLLLLILSFAWLCFLGFLLKVSKVSLVDLAGSERADSTGAKGTRLKVKMFSSAHMLIQTKVVDQCVLCIS